MSPEEFDNRLRSTFKDENLPPREHLWQNISTNLDMKQGSGTVWYWMTPVLIAFIAGMAWLSHSMSHREGTETTVASENATTKSAPETNAPVADAQVNAIDKGTVSNQATNNTPETTGPVDINASTQSANDNNRPNTFSGNSGIGQNNAHNNNRSSSSAFNRSLRNGTNPINGGLNTGSISNDLRSNVQSADNNNSSVNSDEELGEHLKLADFNKFSFNYDFERTENLKAYIEKVNIYKPVRNTKVYEPGYFENNKHWLNFGVGAIRAYNTFHSDFDPTYTVHKDLWAIRDKLTSNGAGFNAFVTYQNKFSKNKRFSYEVGFSFTSRTEDIRLNEYSKNVAIRRNDTIIAYKSFVLWTVMPGGDTNYYNLETPFVLVAKNRYSVYTVPFKFNYEQPLSEHTFLSLGIGGGFSLIRTDSARHLDLVKENEYGTSYNNRYGYAHNNQFRGSINSMLTLYTNFNSLGQFGLYCGYQMHLGAYKLNDQYGIRMSDLQYGVTFRRPLILK